MKGDLGLVLKSKAKHAAIAARLNKPFVFSDKPLVVQYEVTLQVKKKLFVWFIKEFYFIVLWLQEGQECGGSYIKLLSSGPETTDLKNVSFFKCFWNLFFIFFRLHNNNST